MVIKVNSSGLIKGLNGLIEELNIYEGGWFTKTLLPEELSEDQKTQRVVFSIGGCSTPSSFRVQKAWCSPTDDNIATRQALHKIVLKIGRIVETQIKSIKGKNRQRALRREVPPGISLSLESVTVGEIRTIVGQCRTICALLSSPDAVRSPRSPLGLSLTGHPQDHTRKQAYVVPLPGVVSEEM